MEENRRTENRRIRRRYRGLFAVVILIVSFFFLGDWSEAASYPALSAKTPLKAYGWRSGKYQLYTDEALTEKGEKFPYGVCNVVALSQNTAKVCYQDADDVPRIAYIERSVLFYDTDYENKISYANADLMLYRRPSVAKATIEVAQFSGGMTVGEWGDWIQLVFYTNGCYQLGWLPRSSYNEKVRLSMKTTGQLLADGTYSFLPRRTSKKALTASSGRLKIAVDRGIERQQFKLKYISDGWYRITSVPSERQLADSGGLILKRDDSQLWKLTRQGAYFYLQAGSTARCLCYSGGRALMRAAKKITAQQWRLVKAKEKPKLKTSVVFSQYDPKWGGATYWEGPTIKTISTSGCGVMALTNAVYALNGEFISPTLISNFSAKRGHYFYNQGTADTLYADFSNIYGKTYHFRHVGKTYSLSTVKKYLKKGSVAIALVPGHYIAIVAYRAKDNSYLVLDSAIYGKRPTTIYGDWVTASTLCSGTMWCEYFHILSRR